MNQDKKKSPCTAGTVTEANNDSILSIAEIETNVKPTMKIGDTDYPIIAYIRDGAGAIPLVDIPMMSDFKWQFDCLQDRLMYPEKYRDKEDVEATIVRLRKWLSEHMVGQTYTADEVKASIEKSGVKPSDRVEHFLINLGLYGYLDAFIDYINVGGTSVDGFFSLL